LSARRGPFVRYRSHFQTAAIPQRPESLCWIDAAGQAPVHELRHIHAPSTHLALVDKYVVGPQLSRQLTLGTPTISFWVSWTWKTPRRLHAEAVAFAIFKDAQKLGSPGVVSFIEQVQNLREHAGLGDDEDALSAMLDAMKTQIGFQVISLCCTAEARLLDLLFLMRECQANPRTTKFLALVSRCYLFGFDAECIAMCRAAVDAELTAEVRDDDCLSVLGDRQGRNRRMFDLTDRMAVAKKSGRFSPDAYDKAVAVRKNGNDVVHRSPSLPRPALEVISDTLAVIAAPG